MKLIELLSQHKSKLNKGWLKNVIETYPSETEKFLTNQKDIFANPVGATLSKGLEELFQELIQEGDIVPEHMFPILDKIIRIRSIQYFTASQSVSFVFFLKQVIRKELMADIGANDLLEELLQFESRIDTLALMAFDIHMSCREKIYEIKAKQSKNQVSRLLKKTGLLSEIPEWNPDPAKDKEKQ